MNELQRAAMALDRQIRREEATKRAFREQNLSQMWGVEDEANLTALYKWRDLLRNVTMKRTGKWITQIWGWTGEVACINCSECGYCAASYYDFCPKCGARMEKTMDEFISRQAAGQKGRSNAGFNRQTGGD